MKTKWNILAILFAVFIGHLVKAQSSCAAPFSISYPSTSNINTGFSTAYEYWIMVTIPSGTVTVTLSKTTNSDFQYQASEASEGTCGALLPVGGAVQLPDELNAMSLILDNPTLNPKAFYIKLTNPYLRSINLNISITNFDVQTLPLVCYNCDPATTTTITSSSITSNIIGTNSCVNFTKPIKINGNVTFKDFITGGAPIIVTNGSKLTLDHVRFTCCHAWYITLQGSAQLKITNGSLLENAIGSSPGFGSAIYSSNSTIVNTPGQPIQYAIEIDNAILNATEARLTIRDYNQVSTPYPFKIQNFINTTRRIAAYGNKMTYPSVATLKAVSSTLNNGYNSPFTLNNDLVYPSVNNPPPNDPASFDYCTSLNKLVISNVGYTAPNGTVYSIDIGSAAANNTAPQNKTLQNIFDSRGAIEIVNSNVNIVNTAFTEGANIKASTVPNNAGVLPQNYLNFSGVGGSKNVAPCTFYNASKAIDINDYYSINILNNTFTSKQTYVNTYGNASTNVYDGIYLALKKNMVTNINNNTFTNLRTAINVQYPTNTIQLGTASIRNNLFRADIANNPANGNRYMADAIIINSLFTPSSEPYNGLITLDIYKNNANLPFRNINLSGIKSPASVNVDQNTAIIRSEPAKSNGSFNDQFALKTMGLSASCNIRDNNWTSFGKARPDQHFGTISIDSKYNTYTCNEHNAFGTAFLMQGASNTIDGNKNYNNTFFNSERGFSIKTNATTLGSNNTSQYIDANSNSYSADLQWNGNTNDTWVDGAFASLNNIAIPNGNTGLPYVPVSNGVASGLPYAMSASCSPASATGLCYYPQTTLPTCLTPNIPCYVLPPAICPTDDTQRSAGVAAMTAEVSNQTTYASFVPQTRRLKKLAIMEQLMQDTTYLDSSLVLKNWFMAQKTSNLGKFCQLNQCLQKQHLSSLQSGLLNFTGTTTFDTYSKQYLSAYLYYQQKQGLLPSHESQLETMATACPMIYGKLVYQSRGLLNLARGYYVHYNDNCPNGNSVQMRTMNNIALEESTNEVNLSYKERELSIYSDNTGKQDINIYDLQGKLLYHSISDKAHEILTLPLNLSDGLYYTIIKNQEGIFQQKLVIKN
jgi:hypothetical protein